MDENNILRLPIKLLLTNGTLYTGDMILSVGGAIERTLNSEAPFIYFADETNARYIAKASIAELTPLPRQRRVAA